MAPKQSCFVEGSMNDRVSAAPPPDFLDEGTSTADYERQFAMDWKPPELQFEGGGGHDGYSNVSGNRNSFMSAHSGMSNFTSRTGATANKTPRGLFGKVREKLALNKSRSSWTMGGRDDGVAAAEEEEEDEDDAERTTALTSFPVPPAFKHKRSESMDPSTLRANNRFGNNNNNTIQHMNDFGKFQRDNTAAANNNHNQHQRGSRPAPPARADSLGTALAGFDPTKRPTREDINANYQSLLASGFFGTHAIQSARFSPPGANNNNKQHRRSELPPAVPSFAQRLEVDANLDKDEQTSLAGSNVIPPSPVRQPPPLPPPSREPPPPPPPPGMDMDVEDEEPASSKPSAIPASATVVFNPLAPPPRTSSRDSDTTMSPPPLPNPRSRKPALAFSAVPYSSTRPGDKPTLTARPYKPPPIALARFSVDSSRPRSLDVQQFARGTKRPFSSAGDNGSQTSFYTHRSSYDYDPMATDGHGGIGVATTTAEEKVESGARKLVKRLKKSASRLSFRSNQPAKFGGLEGNEDGEDGAELQQPPTRTSMSSTVRRSFSWRLGQPKPETVSNSHEPTSTSSSSTANKIFGGFKSTSGGDTFSPNRNSNSSMDHFQPPPPPIPTIHPPTPMCGLPSIAASPSSTDRNRLKKREIRSRRLRRKEESAAHVMATEINNNNNHSPTKPMMDTMDWQHPPSPSKRPRRSDASIFLRALDSSTAAAAATAEVDSDESDFEPDMPVPVVPMPLSSSSGESLPSLPPTASAASAAAAAPCEGMEGVEFSFHFPGRMRPAAAAAAAHGNHLGGGPLAVVPDANRGMPSMVSSTALGGFGANKKRGSVRVVRGDFV